MKAFLAAVCVFALTVVLVWVNISTLGEKIQGLSDVVDELLAAEEEGDDAAVDAALADFCEKWEKAAFRLYLSVDHNYITAIDEQLAATSGACEEETRTRVRENATKLKSAVQNLRGQIVPNLNSII